jgi:hypothetical protein
MRVRNSMTDVVAGVAAVVFAYYGAVALWDVIASALEILPLSSGGLGAVSFGVVEGLLLWLPSVLANRLLARPARRLGGLVRRLHRAHTITIVVSSLLLVVEAAALMSNAVAIPTYAVLAGVLLVGGLVALQFLLLAATLLAFVWQQRSSARFA